MIILSFRRRPTSGRFRLWATVAVGSLGLLSCATEPACGCSEPGAFVVVYGTVVGYATESPVPGAAVAVVLGDPIAPAAVAGACSFPAQPAPDTPAPVTSNALGRYRLTILSAARTRRCLAVQAGLASVGAGSREVTVDFGLPGATDSLRVDVEFAGR